MRKGPSTHDKHGHRLSPAMARCMNFIRRHRADTLKRWPGGLWTLPDAAEVYTAGGDHVFRTGTVTALARCGKLRFTKYQACKNAPGGKYPIEARTPRAKPRPGDQLELIQEL